jgi:hypothetical protein
MSRTNPLAERERALEEAFFRKENERLLEAMRERQAREEQFEGLAEVLGIHAREIIDPLLDLGLREENVTALILAPLVSIAWADRQLDNEERRTILKTEHELGIDPESKAGELLARWLDHRPHESLLPAWAAYVGELCKVLGAEERTRLRDDTVQRAHGIANAIEKSFMRASGPSQDELDVLARIEAAFGSDGKNEPGKGKGKGGSLDDALCSTT